MIKNPEETVASSGFLYAFQFSFLRFLTTVAAIPAQPTHSSRIHSAALNPSPVSGSSVTTGGWGFGFGLGLGFGLEVPSSTDSR